MRPLLALVFTAAAVFAQSDPKIVYAKSFPGSTPPYVSIVIERGGDTTYNETKDPDNAEKLRLEAGTVNAIFDLADKLDRFKRPLESGLKVANMGEKTYRWENGAEAHEAKFNYSQDESAKSLQDWFERITESERAYLELNRVLKHDRLGVNNAVLQVQALWDQKRLVGTPQLLPLLDRVAKNEALINMARDRASNIAGAIRAKSKPE